MAGLQADAFRAGWVPDRRARLRTAELRPTTSWLDERPGLAIWDGQELVVDELGERLVVGSAESGDRAEGLECGGERRCS
jgi:hypothetical protein